MGHAAKNGTHLNKWGTLWKIGHIRKIGHFEQLARFGEVGHTIKNGSHLEKCVTFESFFALSKIAHIRKKMILNVTTGTQGNIGHILKNGSLKNWSHSKWVTLCKIGHNVKTASHFEKPIIRSHCEKWVTVGKNGSHFKKWGTFGKMFRAVKNFTTFGNMAHTVTNGSRCDKWVFENATFGKIKIKSVCHTRKHGTQFKKLVTLLKD